MLERKKICFVVSVPSVVDAFLKLHLLRLSNDYEITVVSNYLVGDCIRLDGVEYFHAPLERKVSIRSDIVCLYVLRDLFLKKKFDAVHSVTPKAGLIAMLAARAAGVRCRIHWFTGQVWATKLGVARAVFKFADKVTAMSASSLLADSNSQKQFLVSEGVCSSDEVQVIGDGSICGVDTGRFFPNVVSRKAVRNRFSIAEDDQIVIFVGRLNIEKGVREMAEAMKLLVVRYPRLHWLVVGPDEGGMVERITKITSGLSGRLHFVGYTRQPEKYMAAADVFCLPSYREGFGSSVIEAAACGLPAVASEVYGLTDAVDNGLSGILVPVGDSSALAKAIDELLGDDRRRAAMGEYARNRAVSLFSSERVVGCVEEFYRRVLSG